MPDPKTHGNTYTSRLTLGVLSSVNAESIFRSQNTPKDKGCATRIRTLMRRRTWTNYVGVLGALIGAHFWIAIFAMGRWHIRYPSGLLAVVCTLFLAIFLSVVAAIEGSAKWFILTAALVASLAFVILSLH